MKPDHDGELASVSKPGLAQPFVMWLAIIVALNWPALSDPPIWDAAFGLFPAAGELADTGFDLVRLLHLPTYHLGGPNCHAESIVTWVTAAVLAVSGKGSTSFVILHLLHFGAAAWILAVLHRFVAVNLGRGEAWAICLTTMLCPVFAVQTRAMYFEIPLAACAVSALVAYAEGRIVRAVVWSLLAVGVKQVGIVVPAVLIAAVLLKSGPLLKRISLAAGIAIPSLAIAALPLVGTELLKAAASPITHDGWWAFMNFYHMPYLKAMPDIVAGMALLVIAGTLIVGRVWQSLRRVNSSEFTPTLPSTDSQEVQHRHQSKMATEKGLLLFSLGYLQILAFAGFFYVVPFVCRLEFYSLPRYFVFLIPLMVFGITLLTRILTSRRVAIASLLLTSGWFVLNRDGAFYPAAQPNNGAIAERAAGCHDLAEVQRAATQATARVPAECMLLYGLPEHYFLNYPWLGYTKKPHPGGRCVTLEKERPKSLQVDDLPDRFYVLVDAVILGGRELRKIVRDAKADPTREVRVVGDFVQEPYRVSLYEIRRIDQPLAADR